MYWEISGSTQAEYGTTKEGLPQCPISELGFEQTAGCLFREKLEVFSSDVVLGVANPAAVSAESMNILEMDSLYPV